MNGDQFESVIHLLNHSIDESYSGPFSYSSIEQIICHAFVNLIIRKSGPIRVLASLHSYIFQLIVPRIFNFCSIYLADIL